MEIEPDCHCLQDMSNVEREVYIPVMISISGTVDIERKSAAASIRRNRLAHPPGTGESVLS